MPVFEYRARADNGADQYGSTFAYDEEGLYATLRQQDLFLLSAKECRQRAIQPGNFKLSRRELLGFTIHLATFLEAGIPLLEALQSLARENPNTKYRSFVEDLISRISSGSTLSESLRLFPKVFDEHYVQMVKAGETTGQLDERLLELVSHLEWKQEVTAQVKQSSTYPIVLISLIGAVAMILMTFTLPKFVTLLQQFNVPLPFPTRIVIYATKTFNHYWSVLPLLIAFLVLTWSLLSKAPQGRYWLDRIKLATPLFGELQRKIALARFAHHLSILNSAGIDALSSLTIVESLVGNLVIAKVVKNIRLGVEAGETLTRRMKHSGEFPTFVVQMLATGEETGNLEGTLKKVSKYYDREVPAAIKQIFTVLEPLILVVMGGLVLFFALAILLPIYQFGTSINK
jgi:type IV pilus assembly protein PilC